MQRRTKITAKTVQLAIFVAGFGWMGCSQKEPPKQEPERTRLPDPRPQESHAPPPQEYRPPPPSWGQMADQAADALARELPTLPKVRASASKLVLAFAPVRGGPSGSMERQSAIRDAMMSRLVSNEAFRASFAVISNIDKADAQAFLQDFGAPQVDNPLGGTTPGQYAPDAVYFLTVSMVETGDSSRLQVKVEHPSTREVVYARDFR